MPRLMLLVALSAALAAPTTFAQKQTFLGKNATTWAAQLQDDDASDPLAKLSRPGPRSSACSRA